MPARKTEILFSSTRCKTKPVGFSEAIEEGMASDGGLYVPDRLPRFSASDFSRQISIQELAKRVLGAFSERDALSGSIGSICDTAFDFEAPLRRLPRETAVLELFHGPTAAFKDFGARFLAGCVSELAEKDSRTRTILVATSGDTGGAIAAAFHRKKGTEVLVLFPKGKVSPRQEQQLTCWGDNVRACAVNGDFDDCQRIAKSALMDPWWKKEKRLVSGNSINLGRLLPQIIYYAKSSLEYLNESGENAGYIIPSGNLGNAVAALFAKKMGFPIREVVLATNENKALPKFFETARWEPMPTVATLANAMDVGAPSNFERLQWLYPDAAQLRKEVRAFSVSDELIRKTIRSGPDDWGQVWCPHTATAVHVREKLSTPHWVIVATAHPAKFESIVEPLIGREVEVPETLKSILSRESRFDVIEPNLQALTEKAK